MSVLITLVVAAPVTKAHAEPAEPAGKSPVAVATAAAMESGEPVRVAGETTPTSKVVANPDGTFTLTQSVQPVRVKQGGHWRPVDLTLTKQPNGTISTVASAVDVRLSSGGSDQPLVVAARNGHEIGLSWQGGLPEPVLDGRTATYKNVLTGVDLVVTAVPGGFSQVLKVKSRKAARNPKLDKITFGSHVKNASVHAVGPKDSRQIEVRGSKGKVVFRGNATRMWDSAGKSGNAPGHGMASKRGKAGKSAAGKHRASMAMKVSESSVTVIPNQQFLNDPSTTYPVYIDPSYYWAGGKNHHAVVQSGYPNARNYDDTAGDLGDLKAGYIPWVGISRSFVEMELSAMHGKYIHAATLRTRVIHSWSCNGGPTELWLTGGIEPSTTWNNQPIWSRVLDTTRVSNHAQYCPSQGGADFNVTGAVREGVNKGWPNITFGLRARNESDKYAWRKFDLNPTLEVRYNSYPNRPTDLSMENLFRCEVGSDRPVIGTATPQLRARVSDPDGGTLYDTGFRLYRGKSGNGQFIDEFVTYYTPSGSFAEVVIPEGVITQDGIYHWEVWTGDHQFRSPKAGDCEFEVDTDDPGMPSVSSVQYPYDSPAGGVGQTGEFTISANGTSDVAYYLYSFTEQQSDDPQNRVDAEGLGGSATIKWTPTLSGPQTLFVRSVDRAGNQSPIYRYKVFVKAHEPLTSGLVGHWKLDGDLTDASGNGHKLQSGGGASTGAQGYIGQAARMDGVDDRFYSSGPVLDTTQSFSVSAWVKIRKAGDWWEVASQSGSRVSGFQLQATTWGDWGFVMFPEDSNDGGARHARVRSEQPIDVGVWTHLVGVYDAGAGELRLYVNGELSGTRSYTSTWNAAGPFNIGSGLWSGTKVDYFPGVIDEVRAYQRVLVPSEIARLANEAVLRAHYSLDEGTGSTTTDSVTGREATLQGDASWLVGRYTSVQFSGSGYIEAPRPAIRTDRSYTVAAWVRADTFDGEVMTAVSLGGSEFSPFLLQYRPQSGGWAFVVTCSATDTCSTFAPSASQAQTGEWVHLTGVYDAVADEARLYVNGNFAGKVTGVTSWNGDGKLLIGRAVWTGDPVDHWRGAIDDVKVFSGVLSDSQISQLAVHF